MLDLNGVRLSGVVAWLGYLLVHLFYLVGLRNRLLVLIRWTVSFLTRGRGARLITGIALMRPANRAAWLSRASGSRHEWRHARPPP